MVLRLDISTKLAAVAIAIAAMTTADIWAVAWYKILTNEGAPIVTSSCKVTRDIRL